MSINDPNFKRLSPFKRCVIQNFPFIEEDFDALTNYGLLCKIVEYLNKVIASENQVQGVTEECVTAFNNLYNYVNDYFNNLDVQEEINNKLDAMVEDGTLQEIIGEYLNATAIWGFDNVEDMTSSTNLINGSYAKTLGYYSKNDGGGATYKIRTITNDDVVDGSTIIEMGDGSDDLIAELIVEYPINVKTLGAYGDGIHDDFSKIQLGIDKFHHNTIYFPTGEYLITQPISIGTTNAEQVDLKLEKDAVIKTNTVIDSLLEIGKLEGSWIRNTIGCKVTIDGGLWNADKTTQAILIKANRKETTLNNLIVSNVSNTGILIDQGTNTSDSSDANLNNISVNGTGTEGNSIGIHLKAYDNKLTNIRVNSCHIAIDDQSGNFYQNIHALAAWSDGQMNKTNYESSTAFKFHGGGISKLNQCYSDTYGTAFDFITPMKVYLTNCQSYHYLRNIEYDTVLFKDNETNANLRLIVESFDWTPPSITGEGKNYGLDLRNTNSNFRQYLTTFDCFKFDNIQINELTRVEADDYINCLTLYQDNSFTNMNAWVKTMDPNKYYPIAIIKGGGITYDMDIQMGIDQAIRAVIYNSASPTINITNLKNNSHSGQFSLALCNVQLIDGIRTSILCVKASASDLGFNPSFQNYKSWGSQIFARKGYSTTPLESPTVSAEASFNPQ